MGADGGRRGKMGQNSQKVFANETLYQLSYDPNRFIYKQLRRYLNILQSGLYTDYGYR